jgi:rubredoxin
MTIDTMIIVFISIGVFVSILLFGFWVFIWIATGSTESTPQCVCPLCGVVKSIDEDGRCPECGQYVEIE